MQYTRQYIPIHEILYLYFTVYCNITIDHTRTHTHTHSGVCMHIPVLDTLKNIQLRRNPAL